MRFTRSVIALVASLCLIWHLLLPSMMSYGWAPAMYGMSLHCQMLAQTGQAASMALMTSTDTHKNTPALSHTDHVSMQHAQTSHPQQQHRHNLQNHQQAYLEHQQHQLQQHHSPSLTHFLALSRAEVLEIIELASKIMKQCPLCSHGFGAAVILVSFVLLLLGLSLQQPYRQRFAIVRHADAFYQKFRFRQPLAHAPPLFSSV